MGVEFNDEMKPSVLYSRFQASNQQPTLVRWILASGLVKTQSQANAVLLVIMCTAFILTGIVIYRMNAGGGGGGGTKPSPEQIRAMEAQMRQNASQNQQ